MQKYMGIELIFSRVPQYQSMVKPSSPFYNPRIGINPLTLVFGCYQYHCVIIVDGIQDMLVELSEDGEAFIIGNVLTDCGLITHSAN